jgi:hypothetical protein
LGTRELDNPHLLWVWTILSLIYDAVLVVIAHNAFTRDFREIASENFESPAKAAKTKAPKTIATPRRRFRPIRWATAAIVIVLTLCALAALRRNRLGNQVAQQIVTIRAAGLPTTPVEAAGWRPAPTEREDAAALFAQAHIAMRLPRRPNPIRFDTKPLSGEEKEVARNFVATNAAALKILEDLPNRRPIVRSADTRRQNHFAPDNLLQLLEVKALLDLEEGAPTAAQSISQVLHLARLLEGEYFGAQNAGRHGLQIASELLERAAISGRFTAAEWREWRNIVSQIDPLAKLRATLVMHRVEGLEVFGMPPEVLWQNFARGTTSFPSIFSASLSVRRFVGQDQREILDFLGLMNTAIEACDRQYWEQPGRSFQHGWRPAGLGFAGSSMILPHLMPATDWLRRAAVTRLTRVRLMQLAADIEIYRAQHGQLPAQLSGIGTTNLLDPFDGQPLRYRADENGYLIYSVGEDRQDNGGQRWGARNTGDIIFNATRPGS